MSKYEINYVCGHSSVEQLYGPHKGRDYKAEWLAKGMCDECRRDARAKMHAEANAAAAAANAAQGLPALRGSERQVAWAESIRYKAIAAGHFEPVKLRAGAAAALGISEAEALACLDRVNGIISAFRNDVYGQTEARWFIDRCETIEYEVESLPRRTVAKVLADLRDPILAQ